MSTTTAFNPKTALIDRLHATCKAYLSDLAWIPADKLSVVPMGKARPPLEFTAECAGFNNWVAALAEGNPLPSRSSEEIQAQFMSMQDTDDVPAALQSSVDRLTTALDKLDDEALFAAATAPWGSPSTVYILAGMCASHMMYHDGQINYIQALYGDDSNHW